MEWSLNKDDTWSSWPCFCHPLVNQYIDIKVLLVVWFTKTDLKARTTRIKFKCIIKQISFSVSSNISHPVNYISVHFQFDDERYLLNIQQMILSNIISNT